MTVDLNDYDRVVINTSAGKDSQAMMDYVVWLADQQRFSRDKIVALHCDLGLSPGGEEIEWPGTKELAAEHAAHYGLRFVIVKRGVRGFLEEIDYRGKMPGPQQRYCTSKNKEEPGRVQLTVLANEVRSDCGPDPGFLETVERREHWPKPSSRSCTSDFKRDQGQRAVGMIASEARKESLYHEIEHRGKMPSNNERYCTSYFKRDPANTATTELAAELRDGGSNRPWILQCFGFRAEESPRRKKMANLEVDKRSTTGRKMVKRWLPIQDWTVGEVWARIKKAGTRHHPAYDQGMTRLSCRFCIFAPKSQLMLSAKLNPALFHEYVELEARIGHRFRMDLSLAEVKAALESGEQIAQDDGKWNM